MEEECSSSSQSTIRLGILKFTEDEYMEHLRLTQEIDELFAKEKARKLREKERRALKSKEKQLQKTNKRSSMTSSSSIDRLNVYDTSGTVTKNMASQGGQSSSKNSREILKKDPAKHEQSTSDVKQHLREVNNTSPKEKGRLWREAKELQKGMQSPVTHESSLGEQLDVYEISGRIMKKLASRENISKTKNDSKNKQDTSNQIRNICREVSREIEQFISKESEKNKQLENRNIKTRSMAKKTGEKETAKERFIQYITPKLYEKMCRIHEDRNVGLYAICDNCDKSRYLKDVVDPLDLPDKWYCYMNPDENFNSCIRDEVVEEDEDYLIQNSYNAGSIVIVKYTKSQWWPAIVEDDPKIEEYYKLGKTIIPTHYHVTLFDVGKPKSTWVQTASIKPFKANMDNPKYQSPAKCKDSIRLKAAFEKARHAILMPSLQRLRKYSIIHSLPIREASKSRQKKNSAAVKKSGKK